MRGATSREKPTQRRLEGFTQRVSGLLLPGRAARELDEKQAKPQKMVVKQRRSGLQVASSVARPFYIGGHSGTKRDTDRAANERRRANKRARASRRRNRV